MAGLLVVAPPGPVADALCATLADRGFEIQRAPTGAVAVDLAARQQPEAILMDPALSAMDRWHAVKRLNNEPQTSRIPVLTLVSDADTPNGLQRLLAKIERTLGTDRVERADRGERVGNEPGRTEPGRTEPVRTAGTGPASATPAPRTPARAVTERSAAEPADSPSEPSATERGKIGRGRRPVAEVQVPPPATATGARTAPAGSHQVQRILVVDDNAMNRDMLARRLERKGFEVHTVESGESALAALAHQRFDLVLLDWMMPGMSGLDVLHRIRENHPAIELPVIMATAKSEADDIVEALKADANDYVTKPLNFEVVHARIRTQLKLVESHRELLASERRFRALLENTGDMIVQFRPQGQVSYVSPASRALLGFEPEELRRRGFYDWIHPVDRRALEEQQRRQPTLPPAFTFIARMQRQDRKWIWVETSCRALREAGAVMIQAACRDVTEHMERLAGDEPPLPLGGDIMAHPGWRGRSEGGSADLPADRALEANGDADPGRRPLIFTVVVGEVRGLSVDEVSSRVSNELRKVLGADRDG